MEGTMIWFDPAERDASSGRTRGSARGDARAVNVSVLPLTAARRARLSGRR
jgi:hypothetical protein